MEATLSPPIRIQKPKLQPLLHAELGEEEIPFYDEEFDLMQGEAHKDAVSFLIPAFKYVALETRQKYQSDQPSWYIDPDTNKQKMAAGDIVIAQPLDVKKMMATELVFVLEVVTISHAQKEKKDTLRMKRWNEYNEVPEFCLYFPDVSDSRVLQLFHFENGVYQQIEPDSDGMICSKIIPDLCFRELPRDKWTSGHKIELWFRKEEIFELGKERLLRKQAEKKAMVLAEKLRAMGIDPDTL